jgi:hypothetical protein
MSYIEKAYAVMRGGGSYNRLGRTSHVGEAPTVNRVMEDLAGPYDFADLVENQMYRSASDTVPLTDAMLRDMLSSAGQRATVAASAGSGIPSGVVPNHAYAVLGRSRTTVLLRNPQGGAGAEVSFTLEEFRSNFRAVLQAHTSG